MLIRVLRATSSGDDSPDAVEIRLAVVAWVPLRDPVGKLCPESIDDGAERTEARVDMVEDDVLDALETRAVVPWAPLRDLVGTLLCPDDGCERTEERVDRGGEGSTEDVLLIKYSITSSSKSRGGICGQLNDTDEDHQLRRKLGRREIGRLGLTGGPLATTEL
jgi:hypothetical protein